MENNKINSSKAFWELNLLKKEYFKIKGNNEEDEHSMLLENAMNLVVKFQISQMTQDEIDNLAQKEAGMPS